MLSSRPLLGSTWTVKFRIPIDQTEPDTAPKNRTENPSRPTHHSPPITVHPSPSTHHSPPITVHPSPSTHHSPPITVHPSQSIQNITTTLDRSVMEQSASMTTTTGTALSTAGFVGRCAMMLRSLFLLVLVIGSRNVHAFSPASTTSTTTSTFAAVQRQNPIGETDNSVINNHHHRRCRRCRSLKPLRVAFTPIGPFCPYRSSNAVDAGEAIDNLPTSKAEFMDEMEKIQQDLDMDTPIDPDRLMKAANTFETAGNQWMSLRSRLDNASDYQTREYALFSKLHMQANGVDPDQMALLLMWQGGCLRSMARNIPPPMPPHGLDM